MKKRMVNTVSEYFHVTKYGYKIFKESLSLAFTKHFLFSKVKGFVFLPHHLFQNPIKNF